MGWTLKGPSTNAPVRTQWVIKDNNYRGLFIINKGPDKALIMKEQLLERIFSHFRVKTSTVIVYVAKEQIVTYFPSEKEWLKAM